MSYLLIDIGNSRVKIAIATKEKREEKIVISTGLVIEEPLDEFILQYIINNQYSIGDIRTAIVSSVVPEYNATIRMACNRLGMQVLFITQDIPLPLETAFPIPPMMGVDRLLLAYGAKTLFPNTPSIVVSFGTATTFNCIDNSMFLGGLIFSGVMQSLHALLYNASQLRTHSVCLSKKEDKNTVLIAQTTEDSIQKGILEGFASMTEGLLSKLSKQYTTKPKYIAAGGMASILASYTSCFDRIQEDLVLDAMFYLIKKENI